MKNCDECGGEIQPQVDFFKRSNKAYKSFASKMKEYGVPLDDGSSNCIECGKLWDKDWKPMKIRLAWLKQEKVNEK